MALCLLCHDPPFKFSITTPLAGIRSVTETTTFHGPVSNRPLPVLNLSGPNAFPDN